MPGVIFPVAVSLDRDTERSDYRPVPRSDTGESYHDQGAFGDWSANDGKPYQPADDIKYFDGFGAEMSDIQRGYVEPTIREDPAYDLSNYKERSTQPRLPDDDQGNRDVMERDWEFRSRNRRARGFLTRPHIPTER